MRDDVRQVVDDEADEVWERIGKPSGKAIVRAVASVLDDFADQTREYTD